MSAIGMRELNEQQLLQACQRSTPEHAEAGFRALYQQYSGKVFGFVRRLVPDRGLAEDCVQETFVRLFRSLDRVEEGRPLKPYVFKIAHNVVLTQLQRLKRHPRNAGGRLDELEGGDDVIGQASRRELRGKVADALLKLAPEHRAVLVLRHIEAMKLRDIAEVLECTERTARNRIQSAAVLFERELRRSGLMAGEGAL